MYPDGLVLNTRAVGIRGVVIGRDEKEREQLVLQEGRGLRNAGSHAWTRQGRPRRRREVIEKL